MDSEEKKKFNTLLRSGNVSLFEVEKKSIPDVLLKKIEGRTWVFLKNIKNSSNSGIPTAGFDTLSKVREERSDIYFLDHASAKVLLVDFPATAKYVCIRLVPRFSWLIAIPGLIRRILIGLVSIEGIVALSSGSSKKTWLVLKHKLTDSLHTRLCLSDKVGVRGFLDFLNFEKINYVVLRFFEKLPELYRVGGDVDILVSDEDEQKIKKFLLEHPGPVGVDVWTVSRTTFNDITYYPPPLARKILKSAIRGPADARIPAPQEAFLALAYHAVYHKGLFSGVPTRIEGVEANHHPENDYAGVLRRMAHELNIDIDITMENLDEYLGQNGWRPHLDTLAKIATKNRWVWKRFFSSGEGSEVGLGCFILKRKAVDLDIVDSILKTIEDGGFKILRIKEFADQEVSYIANSLRGGVWHGPSGVDDTYLPAIAILVLDKNIARSSRIGFVGGNSKKGIRFLKKKLRNTFDSGKGSIVHATDNTQETWQYVDVCFPDEVENIKKELDSFLKKLTPSFMGRIRLAAISMPRVVVYHYTRMRRRLGRWFISLLMNI